MSKEFIINVSSKLSEDGEMAVTVKFDGDFNVSAVQRAYVALGSFIYNQTIQYLYNIDSSKSEEKANEILDKIANQDSWSTRIDYA